MYCLGLLDATVDPGKVGNGSCGGQPCKTAPELATQEFKCVQRDRDAENQVRQDPANGNTVLRDGFYPTTTRSFDLALGVAISGTTQYVADFRAWTVHEISNVSVGYGPRAALWLGRGRGVCTGRQKPMLGTGVSRPKSAPMPHWDSLASDFKPMVGASSPAVFTLFNAAEWASLDAGADVAANLSRYVRGWSLGEVPPGVLPVVRRGVQQGMRQFALSALNVRDVFAIGGFLLAALSLVVYLALLAHLKRPDVSTTRFFLGGPAWLLKPRSYFVESKITPRRAFLWWCLSLLLISALAKGIPISAWILRPLASSAKHR